VTRLLFRGARLIDGTGSPEQSADVAVTDGTIAAVAAPGTLSPRSADHVVDSAGLVLAPGFIDAHSHADAVPFLDDVDVSKLSQGVTTEVTGNCGFSLAPCPPSHRDEIAGLCGRLFPDLAYDWSTVADLYGELARAGYPTNVVPLVGHHTLRTAVMGLEDRHPAPRELDATRAELRAALSAGACGLSSGLIYPPGMYADTDELVALLGVLSPAHVYATHTRGEGRSLIQSVDEAIEVAERAGVRLQISHLKAAGRQAWGMIPAALERIDAAAGRGLTVHHDVYPYEANSTLLASCLPPWFHAGSLQATMQRLCNSDALARAEADIGEADGGWENWVDGSGWANIMIASTANHRFDGLMLTDIAQRRGTTAFQAMIDLLIDNDLRVTMSVFAMSPADVREALLHPRAVIGSDGLPPGTGGKPHPRLFGTFTRVLSQYVRAEQVLTLPEAIAKMTSLPARVFGLPDRGIVAPGAAADLVLLDPGAVSDRATYADPTRLSAGIEMVLVNGVISFTAGKSTGRRAGARLRSQKPMMNSHR